MVAFVARGADAFESIIGLQDVGSSILLTLAFVLVLPIGWGYLTAATKQDALPTRTVPSQIGTRLHWRRSLARQRAWASGRTHARSIHPMRQDAIRPGRPSPAIGRLRTRRALHHLTGGWQVVRYPH
jgi:hypothetical protein